jgi:hypothetical protein
MGMMDNGKPDRPKRTLDLRPQRDDPEAFFPELTDKEKAALREKARLMVANELKDRAEKALLSQYLEEERHAHDPEQELVPCFLDLAPHCEYLMLDGVQYYHARLYHVTPSVFAVLVEQMNRGWAHEDQTEVRDERTRRRHRAPAHVGVSNFMDNRRERNLRVSSAQLQGANPAQLLGLGANG